MCNYLFFMYIKIRIGKDQNTYLPLNSKCPVRSYRTGHSSYKCITILIFSVSFAQ